MFVQCRVRSFQEVLQVVTYSLQVRVESSNNVMLRSLDGSDAKILSKIREKVWTTSGTMTKQYVILSLLYFVFIYMWICLFSWKWCMAVSAEVKIIYLFIYLFIYFLMKGWSRNQRTPPSIHFSSIDIAQLLKSSSQRLSQNFKAFFPTRKLVFKRVFYQLQNPIYLRS